MIAHSKLTLRRAYTEYLQPEHTKARTIEAYRTLIKHWENAALTLPGSTPADRIPAEDPDLASIDNLTMLEFKSHLTKTVPASNSVRKYLKHLFVVLNRIGPKSIRHPEALGIISEVPYVKLPKEVRKIPTIVTADEITALYEVAEMATWPRCEIPPELWWRSLIVALFNIGLRRLDYLAAEWREFDLHRGVLLFDAEKTEKVSELPLHPAVIFHLREIAEPARRMVWPWRFDQAGPEPIDKKKTSLYAQWHRLRKAAGIARPITPHDIRATCGSDLFVISPAAASECLQHSSIVTTQRSYVNCSRETRDLMLSKQQPDVFSGNNSDGPDDPPDVIPFPKIG